jgi:hypothetical protein
MTSKPRPWPNCAASARDLASEQANRGVNALRPILEKELTPTDQIRRIGIALDALQTIARALEGVGAQTEPN